MVEEIQQLQDTLRDAIQKYLAQESLGQREFAAKVGCTLPTLDTFLRGDRNWELKMIGRALTVMNMRLSELTSLQLPKPINAELAKYQDRLRALHESDAPGLWNIVKQTIDTWCAQAQGNKTSNDGPRKTAEHVPRCPQCHHPDDVRPSRRRPWDWILALFLLSPYRCTNCWSRFHRFRFGNGLGVFVPAEWRRKAPRSSVPDNLKT